jgi:hypothetical protein
MEKIQLSLLFKIIGIGSASGLIYDNQKLHIISDNSTFLYEYSIDSKELNKIPLVENPSENIPKNYKLDFESITKKEDTLCIFGSGSTENRNMRIDFNSSLNKVVATNDLSDLYFAMQNFGEINPEDFNIEGVIYKDESWYFFNRGNGKTNKNKVFTIDGKNLTNEFRVVSNHYKLPKIKGVRTSFTDAIAVDETIYFLATAEDTTSTYDDGEVLGSIIGTINLKTMKLGKTFKISDSHKFEGLTLFTNNTNEISFLLCEDNDTELLESNIYQLTIKK